MKPLVLPNDDIPRTRLDASRFTAWILVALSVCVFGLTVFHGLHAPLDYDGAYNLQIVANLTAGQGYTSLGAVHDSGAFDPFITTGPAVLLPVALAWWLMGGDLFAVRLVMVGFMGLYLYGIFKLGRSDKGELLPIACALALPLMLTFSPGSVLGTPPGPAPLSLSYIPGMVLGEIPAAAFILIAATALSRTKPATAGIWCGLAVQAKLTYALAGAAIFIVWICALIALRVRGWWRAALRCALAALLPLALFECYRFLSLGGLNAYRSSIAELGRFLASQTQIGSLDREMLETKVGGLYQALESPGWVGIILALGVVAIAVAHRWFEAERPSPPLGGHSAPRLPRAFPRDLAAPLHTAVHAGLFIGAALLLVNWMVFSGQLSSRQGLPALLLGLPSLGYLLGSVYSGRSAVALPNVLQRLLLRALYGLAFAAILLALLSRTTNLIKNTDIPARLAEQHRVAEIIRASGATAIATEGWWQNPEFLLLTGLPPARLDPSTRQLLVVQDYQALLTGVLWMTYKSRCHATVYESPAFLVCWSTDQRAQ
jgi:hypothetical protein